MYSLCQHFDNKNSYLSVISSYYRQLSADIKIKNYSPSSRRTASNPADINRFGSYTGMNFSQMHYVIRMSLWQLSRSQGTNTPNYCRQPPFSVYELFMCMQMSCDYYGPRNASLLFLLTVRVLQYAAESSTVLSLCHFYLFRNIFIHY